MCTNNESMYDVPRVILFYDENKLSPRAKLLYVYIKAQAYKNDGKFYETNKTISIKFNTAVRSIQRAIKQLQDERFLTIKKDYEHLSQRCITVNSLNDASWIWES